MAVSVIASTLLSLKLKSTAKNTESPALEAISQNIRADIYSAGGVLMGMLAIFISDGRLAILDPVLAILVSVFIFRSGYVLSLSTCY